MKKILILLLILSPLSLEAHPHIWIDASVKIDFNEKKQIVSITEVWEFDEMFSLAIINANDENKDKKFNEKELINVKKTYFLNLKDYGFYTNIFVDGKEISLKMKLTDFSAEIVDESVIYVFTLILSKPLDPFKHKVNLGIYDSQYYTDIFYAEDPFYAKGIKEGVCPYSIFEDKAHPTYFGLVNPKTIRLCRKS